MSVDLRDHVLGPPRAMVTIVRAPLPPLSVTADLPAGEEGLDRATQAVSSWWEGVLFRLHRWIYGSVMEAATGLEVPAESIDPEEARRYLVDVFAHLAAIHRWPGAAVALRIESMRTQPVAVGVVATVQRLAEFGPDASWPGAASWYVIANQVASGAALVSAGEASAVIRLKVKRSARAMQRAMDDAGDRVASVIDTVASNAAASSGAAGTTIGTFAVAALIGAVGYAAHTLGVGRQR